MEILFAGAAGALPCLLFGGFAALVAVLIILGIIKAREHREAMARFAASMGFQYYADDPWDLPSRYQAFDLFGAGHSKHASNILAGKLDGRTALVFDYSYKTGSGKNETTHSHQAAVLEWPLVAPKLLLRRESVFDTVASWVGHDDIDFESEEFSKKYFVKCQDRKFAYDLFHARLIQYLLSLGSAPAMETAGPILLLYDEPGGPEKVQRLLGVGQEIIRSIPEYVLHQRGMGQQAGGQK